jgi:hypothetical protein
LPSVQKTSKKNHEWDEISVAKVKILSEGLSARSVESLVLEV